jgi:transposase-like protein
MELSHFERLKRDVASKTTAAQILELEDVVRVVVARQFANVALARRTASVHAAGACPRCGTLAVVRYGKDKNDRQRFMCRGCHRTFNILTGTLMARARKPDVWGRYLDCVSNFMSVRKIVLTGIAISHLTVFRWRHRFLAATINDTAAVLSGVIEVDETFFVRSFKGHRGWTRGLPPENRAARPTAWGALKRGLSLGQVPVLSWTPMVGSTGACWAARARSKRRWQVGSHPARCCAAMERRHTSGRPRRLGPSTAVFSCRPSRRLPSKHFRPPSGGARQVAWVLAGLMLTTGNSSC